MMTLAEAEAIVGGRCRAVMEGERAGLDQEDMLPALVAGIAIDPEELRIWSATAAMRSIMSVARGTDPLVAMNAAILNAFAIGGLVMAPDATL